MKTTLIGTVLLLAGCLNGQVVVNGIVAVHGPVPGADEIRAAEQRVSDSPFGVLTAALHYSDGDIEARLQLIRLYNAASIPGSSEYRLPRFNQIRLLVQERPGQHVASFPTYVGRAGGYYPNAVDHEAMATLWLAQANRFFDDPRVVSNALRFLSVERKDLAEELFVRSIAAHPQDSELRARLGFFYAEGIAGADFADGEVLPGILQNQRDHWAAHSRQALEESSDARVLIGASIALPNVAMRRKGGVPEFEASARYSEELRRRADGIERLAGFPPEQQLYATEAQQVSGAQVLQASPPPPPPPPPRFTGPAAPPSLIRVSTLAATANILTKVDPVYPELARKAQVQGTVRFDATIDETGKIKNLQLVSGPPLLVMAAMKAVQKWVFKPTMLNDAPIAVTTTLEVFFVLP